MVWADTEHRRWLRSALYALPCSVPVCCVYIFHFVSSDTFRVKKSPKRSPLSDPPSQVYCSLDIYDFVAHLGVGVTLGFYSPLVNRLSFVLIVGMCQHPLLASYMEGPSVFARHCFGSVTLGGDQRVSQE